MILFYFPSPLCCVDPIHEWLILFTRFDSLWLLIISKYTLKKLRFYIIWELQKCIVAFRAGVLVHFHDMDTSGILEKAVDPFFEKCLKLHNIKNIALQKIILKNRYQNILKNKFAIFTCKLFLLMPYYPLWSIIVSFYSRKCEENGFHYWISYLVLEVLLDSFKLYPLF